MFKAKLHILLLFSLVLLCSSFNAQIEAEEEKLILFEDYLMPKRGTYEIYSTLEKGDILFTNEHLKAIEKARHDTEEVILYLGYYSTVRILPRSIIEREDFVPLPER